MRMESNRYNGVEHVPTCSTWPPPWLTAARLGADALPPANREQPLPLSSEADREMSKAIAVIDEALSATWLTQPQRNVLAVFREQVSDYHAQQNPLLFGSDAWIGQHVMRWRAEHENVIRGS